MHGLKQAPRAWFEKLKGALLARSFKNSVSDTSLFFAHKSNRPNFLLVYVDDILISGENSDYIQWLVKDFNIQFALKNLSPISYFSGFEVVRSSSSLHLSQTIYAIDLFHKINLLNAKDVSISMCVTSKLSLHDSATFDAPSLYRSTVGALQYLTLSRPDFAYSVNRLSQYLKERTLAH